MYFYTGYLKCCPELNGDAISHITPKITQQPPGTEITVKCKDGYLLSNGRSVLSCAADANWNQSLPACREYGKFHGLANNNNINHLSLLPVTFIFPYLFYFA